MTHDELDGFRFRPGDLAVDCLVYCTADKLGAAVINLAFVFYCQFGRGDCIGGGADVAKYHDFYVAVGGDGNLHIYRIVADGKNWE